MAFGVAVAIGSVASFDKTPAAAVSLFTATVLPFVATATTAVARRLTLLLLLLLLSGAWLRSILLLLLLLLFHYLLLLFFRPMPLYQIVFSYRSSCIFISIDKGINRGKKIV